MFTLNPPLASYLTEAQYVELCDGCDLVLRAPDAAIERVSIPWLHIIREHPVFLKNYVSLFEQKKRIRLVWEYCARSFLYLAWWLRQLAKAIYSNGLPWVGSKQLPDNVDFLFISHILNISQIKQSNDFYFGEVPAKLAEQGYVVVIAMINHSGASDTLIAKEWSENAVPRIILSEVLSPGKELAIHSRLKKESIRLKLASKRSVSVLDHRILSRASQESLSSGAHRSLRMTEQIGTLATLLRPKSLIVTYEGHAWEKAVFYAARKKLPTIKCIGYQHSALFKLQHAIRRNLAKEFNPDFILTAGSLGKRRLEQSTDMRTIPINVGGSIRGMDGRISNKIAGMPDTVRTCLVLPEGILSECNLLFEFSLACAQICPEVRFIWRLHPSIDFNSLISKNRKFKDIPCNIVLSKESLESDVAQSDWALYRGTTAIIQAIGSGVRPIYLRLVGEMSIDPLYDLDVWREVVDNINDFKSVVELEKDVDDRLDKSDIEAVRSYCNDFFAPMNLKSFESAAMISKQ